MPRENRNAFAKICNLAGKAVKQYRMIRAGDRVVVGLSWGKDSLVLMHVMQRLQRRSPVKFELHAAWVDSGFNDDEREEMAAYAARHG